jgi:hypothetical protein
LEFVFGSLKFETSKTQSFKPKQNARISMHEYLFEDLLVGFGNSKKAYTTREQQTRFLPNDSLHVFNQTICACVTGPTRGHEWALE